MAKASKAGLTKTRLARTVGMVEAAQLNTAFLHDVVANITEAARAAPITGYMAFGPPGEGSFFDFLPSGFGLVEAWQPSFGETLVQAFEGVTAKGHGCACLLNADSPTLPPALLARAATSLLDAGERVVLGPSADGGYYLLGAKRLHHDLFRDIAWSTNVVFEQTIDRAARLGLDVVVLPDWYDVDDAESFSILRSELFGGGAYGSSGLPRGAATHTSSMLMSLGLNSADAPANAPP